MTKNTLIDDLLYKYAEVSFNKKYDAEIESYSTKMTTENSEMSLSFEEFWNRFNNKTIVKKKKRRRVIYAIVASLVIAFVAIGPSNVITFAREVIQKIIKISEDKVFIEFEETGSYEIQYTNPSYVPKSHKIENVFENEHIYSIDYSNGNEEENISYSVFPIKGTGINNDGEKARLSTVYIEGVEVIVTENFRRTSVDCAIDSQIYSLVSTIEKEELLKMMENILKQHMEGK
ncbi:DUF4367 domain-containing protein [Peptostreptococcaceae bacterium OttesenSCG-928-C18]|nr:DUF4367 domain-containing protein [Peptostreptococcaceae bacterium OttesenSCG-928-C18]